MKHLLFFSIAICLLSCGQKKACICKAHNYDFVVNLKKNGKLKDGAEITIDKVNETVRRIASKHGKIAYEFHYDSSLQKAIICTKRKQHKLIDCFLLQLNK